MRKGSIYVYHGEGKGKTTQAIGQGIRSVGEGLTVIMIQFLDYNDNKEAIPLKKLEPDFKIFRFEKNRDDIDHLNEEETKELIGELQMAFQFSKKILDTGECDILILDGINEAIKHRFIDEDAVCEILDKKPTYMDVIMTGSELYPKIAEKADYIFNICTEKRPS